MGLVIGNRFAITVAVPLLRSEATDDLVVLGEDDSECVGDGVAAVVEFFYLKVVLGCAVE